MTKRSPQGRMVHALHCEGKEARGYGRHSEAWLGVGMMVRSFAPHARAGNSTSDCSQVPRVPFMGGFGA